MKLSERFHNYSLKKQILYVYIPLLIVSIVLVFAFISNANAQSRRQEAYYQLGNSTDVMRLLLEDRLEGILNTFVSIEESEAFSKMILNYRYDTHAGANYSDRIHVGNMLEAAYSQYYQIIDSVYIRINDSLFTLMKRYSPLCREVDAAALYEQYGQSGAYLWGAPHTDTIFPGTERQVFSLAKFYGRPDSDSSIFGVMILNIRKEYVLDLMHNMPISTHGYWALVADGALFTAEPAAEAYRLRDGAAAFLLENCGQRGHFETRSTAGESLYVHFDGFGNSGWGIAAIMPTAELQFHAAPPDYNSLFLALCVVAVMLFFAVFFANRISLSLSDLSGRVERLDSNAMPESLSGVSFHLEGSKEVTALSDALDNMTGTIHRLVDSIYEKQQRQRRIELAALQEQIKPHFIYNALSTVLYEIDSGQNAQASDMLRSLITFFRLSVNHGNEVCTIADEIAHAESYLHIQQLRSSRSFTYGIQADEDLLCNEILKFTLQPLVENAIAHGFSSVAAGAERNIYITITQRDECVKMEVLDNGAGIAPEALERLRREIHEDFSSTASVTYGLKNVDLRIRLKYGAPYGLEVESEAGLFTAVTVSVPLRRFSAAPVEAENGEAPSREKTGRPIG